MLFALTTCDKKYSDREFPSVITVSAETMEPEGILFSGEIIIRNAGEIQETGFIWQSGTDPLEKPGYKINLGAPSKSGPFQTNIFSSITKDSKYFVRAYAVSGNVKVFGEKLEFESDSELPVILKNFEPSTGHVGDTIKITGVRFNSSLSLNQVKFDTLDSQITSVNDTVLYCIIPIRLNTRLSTIKVISSGSIVEFDSKYTLVTPSINSFNPQEAFMGDFVKISGSGFHRQSNLNLIKLGDLPVNTLSSNESEIIFQVPYTIDTLCYISVSVSGQKAVSKDRIAISLPHFNMFTPSSAGSLDTIMLNITNLKPEKNVSVYFNNIPARIILRDRFVLQVEVPISLTQEYSELKVIVDGEAYIFPTSFRLLSPTITGVSSGNIKYGNILTIYGKNFLSIPGASYVYLKGGSETYILTPMFVSADSIKVEIYNQQQSNQLLNLSSYRLGIKTFEKLIWSDFDISLVSSWGRVQDFPGNGRYKTTSFSLGGNFYTGGGAGNGMAFNDFWKYNPDNNSWSRMADVPGLPRVYPRSFSNSTNGFLGSGFTADNASKSQLIDFYKYSPETDSWSPVSNYPDNILNFYPGFTVTVNGRPYASLSNQALLMREMINDSWISRPTISELIDCPAAGIFSIGNKFYVIIGYRINNTSSNAVWEYNTANGNWTKKSDFPGPPRCSSAFFSIDNYGYYGCGMQPDLTQFKDMWRYNPSNDKWIRIEDFPGGLRSHLIGSTVGQYGFVGLGLLQYPVTYLKDFWKFNPR